MRFCAYICRKLTGFNAGCFLDSKGLVSEKPEMETKGQETVHLRN
ncbi:hypothetical protein M141_3166 [Bacteroides fragilis str. S38L5]|uniref:Uncharacterized protein n=2 Tax=Bacteroides fragilis TaxID=817 RepID=A0A015XAD5_BACFG|nr:hypothetical protein M101_3134 [Bacteroides fragilis str. 1007-1-F \